MSKKSGDHDMALGNLLDDIPTMEDIRLEGGFFAGLDRGEWLRNLEHHLRYGEDLLMLWSEPGVGKSTLLTHLASRLDAAVFTVVTLDARRGGSAEHVWSALDKRLTLPSGAEGWEALKRTAKKLAAAGQSLAVIIDHADKLNKEAVKLIGAMLDARLPECRFLLALDGAGVSTLGQWPLIEAQLFERGQLARLWPFSEEDAQAYIDFRLQHAQLGDVVLGDKQKQQIFERSEGNAGNIRAEMQRLLTGNAIFGKSAGASRKTSPPSKNKNSYAVPPPPTPPANTKGLKKPKRASVLPKAHSVALSVLAVALIGFYFVWEKPVPPSIISTPSPNAQTLPPVIKTRDAALPVSAEMQVDPPASGGLSELIKETIETAGVEPETTDRMRQPVVERPASLSQSNLQPPAGFVPSNVPLMSTQVPETKDKELQSPAAASLKKVAPAASKSVAVQPMPMGADTSQPGKKSASAPPPSLAKTPVKPAAIIPTKKREPVVAKVQSQPKREIVNSKPQMVAKAMAPAVSQGAYTLQIMGLRDLRSVQAVMQRNAGVKGLRYHATSLNGQPWYVIVQGEYPSRQAAQAAVKSLPAALQASKPFPKSLSAVTNP